jgi:hypothetical protein
MTGQAIALRLQLAQLLQRHGIAPAPFNPPPLLAPTDHAEIIEGYAAPAVVDRERMKFAERCWLPFAPDIPLLVSHDPNRVAGTIEDLTITERGLFVRARVTDPQARRLSFFSVAATIYHFQCARPTTATSRTGSSPRRGSTKSV